MPKGGRFAVAVVVDGGAVRPAAQLGRCGEWIKTLGGGKLILKGHHGRRRRAPGRQQRCRCTDRETTTVAASSMGRLPPLLHCLTLPKRWARTSRCGWMAAFAAGKMCSRPVLWGARRTLIGPAAFLYGLGAFGEGGRDPRPWNSEGWTSPWLSAAYQHQQRGPLRPVAGAPSPAVTRCADSAPVNKARKCGALCLQRSVR